MKKICILLLCTFFISLIAPSIAYPEATLIENNKESISPFPTAKKGINFMPIDKMNIPQEMKESMIINHKSMLANGYTETTSEDDDIVSLLKMKDMDEMIVLVNEIDKLQFSS